MTKLEIKAVLRSAELELSILSLKNSRDMKIKKHQLRDMIKDLKNRLAE